MIDNGIQEIALKFFNDRSEANFNPLYTRLKPGLIFYVTGIVKDSAAAEDIVSMAFCSMWTKIEQYNPFWNFSTWAYKISLNESLLYIRKKTLTSSLESFGSNVLKEVSKSGSENLLRKYSVSDEYVLEEPNWEIDQKEEVIDLVYNKVIEEIEKLPRSYKQIMIDREIQKMKYEDISEKHNMKINSVKTKIRRARMIIRKKVEKKHPEIVKALCYKDIED